MKALINFNQREKGNTKFEDLDKNDKKKIMMKEACNAMIAHMFLDSKQKQTLKKIFKIMDKSGDGQLQADELQKGFKAIFKNTDDIGSEE